MIPSIVQEIEIKWHIEDIQSIRPDLSDEQASIVLTHLHRNHDASVGINWEVIETEADILYPSDEIEISDEEAL